MTQDLPQEPLISFDESGGHIAFGDDLEEDEEMERASPQVRFEIERPQVVLVIRRPEEQEGWRLGSLRRTVGVC